MLTKEHYMKFLKNTTFAIGTAFILSGCADMENFINNLEPAPVAVSSNKGEKISFAQYLTDIAINESIPSSFKVRYKSGRYGIMHFIIKPNSDYSEAYIGEDNPYYKDRIVANNEAGAMFDYFKKIIRDEKISLSSKVVKNCSEPDLETLMPRYIYQAKVNDKKLYIVYSHNAGGSGGGATASIRIFRTIPQCSYIQKLNGDI